MTDTSFENQRDEYLESEAVKPDNERFGNWISKLAASKAAGIARPTLDVWIANGTIPDTAIRQQKKGTKTTYLLEEGEVTRIARERVQKRPAQQKNQQNEQEAKRFVALKVLETERDGLRDQVKSLEAQVLRIEDQTTKLGVAKDDALTAASKAAGSAKDAADTALNDAKDAAKHTETLLTQQLEKAESDAKEARDTAKKATEDLLAEKSKGFFKKLFGG